MGRGSYIGEVFSLSGVLKILESALIFVALVVHRHGDHGKYVFFGTSAQSLGQTDSGVDVENLGNGTLVTYAIISPILLLAYILDGRFAIQGMFVEAFWNFLGTILFTAVGVETCITWASAKKQDDFRNQEDYATTYAAGLALGGLCIVLGIVYFVDFCFSFAARSRLKRDPY